MPGSGRNGRTSRRGVSDTPKKGLSRLDATNLAGITDLMNTQNIRPNVNLSASVETIMGRSEPASAAIDPLTLYNKQLAELSEELGIDLLDETPADSTADPSIGLVACAPAPFGEISAPPRQLSPPPFGGNPTRNPLKGRAIEDLIGDLVIESDSGAEGSDDDDDDSRKSSSEDGDTDTGGDSVSSAGEVSSMGTTSGGGAGKPDRELGIDVSATRRQSERLRRVVSTPSVATPGLKRSRLSGLTEEQLRRDHINSVMGDMRKDTQTSFSVEHERVQDIKASKLEQIGQLRMTLEEEGVDCQGAGTPTMSSSVEEIDSVLAILKLKNDRNRYSSLAEEIILGVAEGVETVFDGTREIPIIGWKPDYTGYHNTVNVKLHRMRFETSQVVGNVVERYNINPLVRIFMELLPSFFLYPRQQHKQRATPGLHADLGGQIPRISDAREAYSAIRRADTMSSVAHI